MYIHAGRLDRQITIMTPPAPNDLGEVVGSWVSAKTIWAAYRPMRGKQFQSSDRPSTEAYDMFTIRHTTGITESMRVSYGSTVWDIVHIAEVGRGEGLELVCRRTS